MYLSEGDTDDCYSSFTEYQGRIDTNHHYVDLKVERSKRTNLNNELPPYDLKKYGRLILGHYFSSWL